MKSKLLVIAILLLYALHQDFWNWDHYKPLIFGFVPIGLAYHAAYSIAAALLMWALVHFAWPAKLESNNESTKTPHTNSEDKS